MKLTAGRAQPPVMEAALREVHFSLTVEPDAGVLSQCSSCGRWHQRCVMGQVKK